MGQGLHSDPPPCPEVADPVGVGDADVGHEHLGEVPIAVDLLQGPHLHTGVPHVHGKHGQAPVLGHRDVGPGQAHPPMGVGTAGGPHLGAIQYPLVAVAFGPHAGVSQIGAGVRLREHLAPDLRTVGDGPQPAVLLADRTLVQQDRPHEAQPNPVRVEIGCLVVGQSGVDSGCLVAVGVSPAESRGPGGHHPPAPDEAFQVPTTGSQVVTACP